MIERWAPLRPVERQLFVDWLAYFALLAEERAVPEADKMTWRYGITQAAPGHLVDHPDFYACEGQVIAVGYVSSAGMKQE